MAHNKNHRNPDVFSVARGVWGKKELFVNYYFIQDEQSGEWALVDAGLKWSAPGIKAMAKELFGNQPPRCIILTHGHFDHIGGLDALVREWHVPVYAHVMELPYLTGKSSYPPADPGVGGGMMATMSWMYPRGPVNIASSVEALPLDNSIPGFQEWKYIHTPGHSPGHISLFREHDKVLIAGDAFVTTKAESALCVVSYRKHLSGPPRYLTCNWASAKISVLKLAALDPEIVATGHGYPMYGPEMRNALHRLARRFDDLALPAEGRYVNEPAVADETGVLYVPAPTESVPRALKIVGISLAVATAGILLYSQFRKRPEVASNLGNKAKKLAQKAGNEMKKAVTSAKSTASSYH